MRAGIYLVTVTSFAIQDYERCLSLNIYHVPVVVNALIVFIFLDLLRMLAGGSIMISF